MKNASEILDQAVRLCATKGSRLTPQRKSVLRLICESDIPLSAYEILDRMQDGPRRPAPPTVYRALDFLLAQGLIHKIESLHAFVGCTHPEHPHAGQFLICTDCGRVDELCRDHLGKALEQEVRRSGFQTQRPVVELLGLCANCTGDKDQATRSTRS